MRKMNIQWTAKTLCNQMSKTKINFDCAVQRGLVWDASRKSLLIHSMIYGYAIPAFYFTRNEDGNYDALDGKQRSNAISQFMNNEYILSDDTPSIFDENGTEIKIAKMNFESLPEWARDAIKDYSLTIFYYEDMTEDETKEFFRRLNNGKPLTAIELTRVKANSIAMFQLIANHDAIANSISETGKTRYNDELTAMQIFAMDNMETPDFSNKEFRPYIQTAVVSDAQKDEILSGLNYVDSFHAMLADKLAENEEDKEVKRVLKKSHTRNNLVSLAYAGVLASRSNVDSDAFNKTFYDFFNTSSTSTDEEYSSSVGAGSAKSENVLKRKNAMQRVIAGIV